MFKRILFATGIVLAVVAACDKPKQPEKEDPKVTLSVFPTSHTFEASSPEAFIVSVSCSGDWTASPSDTWITVSPASGNGNASVNVKVAANSGEARTGNVTFQDKEKTLTKTFTVNQTGYSKPDETALVANPDPFDGNKRSSTTYQLLIYSFADSGTDGVGDFKGIQNKLDYLEDLGVTALWLSPAQQSSSYHGYDVTDYSKVNPNYGTEQDFKNLIDAAHAKGIKIYMDYVLNHSGIDNVWFRSALADPSGPYWSYYVFSDNPDSDISAGKIYNYGGKSRPGMGGWTSIGVGKGYKGRLHFKLDWTGSTKTVTVSETTQAAQKANESAKMWIWLGSAVGLYETSAGIFEITYDVDTDWGFLVRSSNTTWDYGTKWGGDGKAITLGKAYTLNNTTAADITFGGWQSYYFHSFPESMPDLDYGPADKASESPAFKALAETADKWIKMGVDGFRLDAVAWIYNESVSANVAFLQQWYDHCNATYKAQGHTDDIFMVGEAWTGHGTEKDYYQGLPSLFEFEYFRLSDDNQLLVNTLKGNASNYVSKVTRMISDHQQARPGAITSFFLTNHDQPRAAEILNKDAAKLKQAAAMLLTTPGKPFVYQGEELGYYGSNGSSDNYIRTPILWDKRGKDYAKKGVYDQIPDGLDNEKYSVEAQEADANSLLNVYKTWSRLRNTYAAFTDGTMTAGPGNGGAVASWYITGTDGSKFLVIHHTGVSDKTIDLSDDTTRPVAVLGTATLADKAGSTKKTLRLGPSSSVVFKL